MAVRESGASETGPVGAEIEEEQRAEALAGEPPFKTVQPSREDRLAAALKDALIAGLITLALAGPIVGLRTVTAIGGLSLEQNWLPVIVAVAIVTVGRLLLNLFVWNPAPGSAGLLGGLNRLCLLYTSDAADE